MVPEVTSSQGFQMFSGWNWFNGYELLDQEPWNQTSGTMEPLEPWNLVLLSESGHRIHSHCPQRGDRDRQ
jgi:hypothetical protein